jgi:hypothetical protein
MLTPPALSELQSLLKSFQRNLTCLQCVCDLDKLQNRNGRQFNSLVHNVKQIVSISFQTKQNSHKTPTIIV